MTEFSKKNEKSKIDLGVSNVIEVSIQNEFKLLLDNAMKEIAKANRA
jgi:hypothetical protein